MKTNNSFSEQTPPRLGRYFARFRSRRFALMLLMATLGVNVAFGADPTTTSPATKTFAEKTFLDVTGTKANAQIKDGDNTVVYNVTYLLKTLNPAFISGTTATDKSDSKSSVSGLADNGFLAEGSSSSVNSDNTGGYSYVKITSDKSLVVYVTGANSVAMLAAGNNTSSNKWIGLGVEEVSADGTLTEVSAPVDNKNYSSNKVITVGPSLTPSKYYKITITSGNTSNCSLWQIRFGQPAADPYTVTFNANGGSCGTSSLTEASAGAGVTLPSATPADEATQEFKGWAVSSTETDPAKIFAAGAKYEPAADVTLYAIYGAKTVKSAIVYANTKGASTAALPTQYTEGVGIASFAALEDVAGFHFTGWNPSSISASATGEQTITAEWEEKPVDIFSMVAANGATSKSVAAGATIALTASEATITGGTVNFKNNNTSAKNVGSSQSSKAAFMLEKTGSYFEIVLPAAGDGLRVGDVISATVLGGKDERGIFFTTSSTNTAVTDYFVKTNTGDASNSYKSGLTYTIKAGDDLIGAKNIYVERYTGNGTYFTELKIARPASSVPNTTWNVSFDMQGATSTAIEAQSVVNGKKAVKPEDPEKDGFNFVKWVVAATEADYDFDASVTADVALKAVWEEITTSWTVTYNANGGTCGTPSATWTGGDALVLPAAEFTGKLFDGWYDSEDNLIGKAGDEYTPTDNIELFAHYSYEKILRKAVFSNSFEAWIDEAAKTATVFYLDGETAPTYVEGVASTGCTITMTDGKLIVKDVEEATVEYVLTMTAVTPATVPVEKITPATAAEAEVSWIKNHYGWESSKGWKFAKTGDDADWSRRTNGNNHIYLFVGACENVKLTWKANRAVKVYRNGTEVSATTADGVLTIPGDIANASMIKIASNQNSGDGGFSAVEVLAHVVGTDATLSALSVADNTIAPAFAAATYEYTCELPYGTAAVPVVSYTLNDENATAVKTDAASVTGTTTIVVTAEDGTTQLTYTIQFSVAAAPAATPTFDTDLSATASYTEGGSVTLSVVASKTDAGTLSYQWYKDETPVGENAASLEVTAEGSYKVVVTNALSESNKATATSTTCVVTETEAAGCNTLSSIPSEAPYQYEQTGEWTLYAVTSAGKLDGSNRFISNATDYKGVTSQNALSYSRIGIQFAENVESVTFYSSASSDRSFSSLKVTADDITGSSVSYDDVTSNFTVNKVNYNDNVKNGVFTATGLFEAGKAYWFTFSGTVIITKVCYTEATVDHVEKGLTSVLVNEVAIADDKLATLNSSKALNLEAEASAPSVKMTYSTTTYFTNGKTIVDSDVETAVNTSDATNYYATATFETVDYVITFPIDRTPEMNLTATEGSIALSGHTRSGNQTTTLTGANLTDGEYSVTVPVVEGLSVSPTSFTVAAGEVNETFTITYENEADVAEAVANIVFSDGVTSKTFSLTYSSEAYVAPTYTAVSASRTWNWKQASSTTSAMTNSTTPAKDEEFLMSDVVDSSDDFHSENLKLAGQYAVRKDGSKYYFQGSSLKLTTTIEGVLEVYFSNTGSKDVARNLFVNGKTTGIGDKTGSENAAKAIAIVHPGEIELNAYLADGSSTDMQYVRIYKVVFTAIDEYACATVRTGLTEGKMGTICLGRDILAMGGATFYQVEKPTAIGVDLVEATAPYAAGTPYIFEANASEIKVVYGEGVATEALTVNGLVGNLTGSNMAITNNDQNYIVQNNHLRLCVSGNYVANERAYLDMKQVTDMTVEEPEGNAPLRRISLGGAEADVVTGFENIISSEDVQKLLIEGNIFIIRDGKIYNALGQLVK